MTVALFTDLALCEHDTGPGHPERPDRLRAAIDGAHAAGFVDGPAGPPLSRADAARIHTARHLDLLERVRGRAAALDPDTVVSKDSVELAYRAAGLVRDAARFAVSEGQPTLALVRPPGHHAEPDRPMGFCLLANVAIAARVLTDAVGLDRVLIVDWDVHHGNGTERTFLDDDRVLVFNTHQAPFYPGTGAIADRGTGHGEGFNVNVPLPAGASDGDYAAVYDELLVPIARRFAPQAILVSAGFDAHEDDPLASMHVTTKGYAHLTQVVKDLADELCGGRLAVVLEGGYDLDALASSVEACARVLQGQRATPIASAARPEVTSTIAAVRDAHARWFTPRPS